MKIYLHSDVKHPFSKVIGKAVQLSCVVLLGFGVCFNANAAVEKTADDAFSQQSQKAVKVLVKDSTGPLAGANIAVKGTSIGANTDLNGAVTIENVPANATLVVSFIGYKTQEIAVGSQNVFSVVLEEDTNTLDEIVVIGYGTVKKRDLTGSVASVKGKDLTQFTVSNPIQALQGRVAGVNITTNTGSPEGNFNIRIRGTNSIRGDNSPLYIIDGMPASMSSINSYDIQSIEVLKDASATAIYGSRGANGVILITTKSGHEGKTNVEYNFEYGVQSLRNKWEMMNATEYMKFYNEEQINDTGNSYFTDAQIAAAGEGFDWQDNVYQNAGVQNHNLSVSGGNAKTKYNISASAMLRDGIIRTTNYDKYNLRSTIASDISKYVNVTLRMGYTYVNRQSKFSFDGGNRGGSLVQASLLSPPTLTPFNEDGSYNNPQLAYPFMSNALQNPYNIIDRTKSNTEANMVDLAGSITIKPFKGFSIKSSFGMENNDYMSDSYTNSKNIYGSTSASVSQNRNTTAINENTINYMATIADDHDISVMAGFTYEQSVSKSVGGSGNGFLSDATEAWNLSSAGNPGIPWSGWSKWSLMSYLARANYSYKGKYLATASIRADGSSRYSEGSKWGYFPSAALAWRISEEPWMKSVEQISDLKLRAGYGVTGSTAIGAYATQNMLSSGATPYGAGMVTYFTPSTAYPGSLKWEQTSQFDVGVDFAMFNNRLRFTADYYYKLTTDLLNSVKLPMSSGYDSTLKNIGSMSNRGLEFLLEGEIISTKDWSWSASGNISLNRNRVEKLAGGNDIYGSDISMVYISGTVNLIREGEPMGVFYVFETDGYDENGTIKYIDQNNDGSYTNDDRRVLGNPHPDFIFGFNTDLSYKNLFLTMAWTGSVGNDVYNFTDAMFYDYGMGLNMRKDVYNSHWTPGASAEQNAKAKYPAIRQNQKLMQCDRFIEDGSYLRLKNIQLGYNIPIKANWIQNLQVYVSAQNILTLTKYRGQDPEVNAYGSDTNIGIDYTTYPMNKSVSVGANIKF